MAKRSPPLTLGVLEALDACMNTSEAGGYIEETQSLDGGEDSAEADRFRANAALAHEWLRAQFQKRARRAKTPPVYQSARAPGHYRG